MNDLPFKWTISKKPKLEVKFNLNDEACKGRSTIVNKDHENDSLLVSARWTIIFSRTFLRHIFGGKTIQYLVQHPFDIFNSLKKFSISFILILRLDNLTPPSKCHDNEMKAYRTRTEKFRIGPCVISIRRCARHCCRLVVTVVVINAPIRLHYHPPLLPCKRKLTRVLNNRNYYRLAPTFQPPRNLDWPVFRQNGLLFQPGN